MTSSPASLLDPEHGIVRVAHIQPLDSSKNKLLVVYADGAHKDHLVQCLDLAKDGGGVAESELDPLIAATSLGGGVSRIWPAGEGIAVMIGPEIWRVTEDLEKSLLLKLPQGASAGCIDLVWSADAGVTLAALVPAPNEGGDKDEAAMAPKVFPRQDPPMHLVCYRPALGWQTISEACTPAALASGLRISANGRRAVWQAWLSYIPEEAERGEFWACDLAKGAAPRQITRGAGRVEGAVLTADGEAAIVKCNFSADRPITTHMDLYLVDAASADAADEAAAAAAAASAKNLPQALTDSNAGGEIVDFGWVIGQEQQGAYTGTLYVSRLAGATRETDLIDTSRPADGADGAGGAGGAAGGGSGGPQPYHTQRLVSGAAITPVVALGTGPKGQQGSPKNQQHQQQHQQQSIADWWFQKYCYGTEDQATFAAIFDGTRAVPVGQRPGFDDFHVDEHHYEAESDGTRITSLFCYSSSPPSPSSPSASSRGESKQPADKQAAVDPRLQPVIVHAHGGPAVAFSNHRRAAADILRYPYRHLLGAGYRVFCPFFRGTLGFGDAFAQANIGKQGRLDSDLGDIVSGLNALVAAGKMLPETPVGIMGGSYGGYMTVRALSTLPDRFTAGVAMYGFLFNRWMTLEGGDFTWETEYIGDPDRWPLDDRATDSDTFDKLVDITAPTLFLHGEDDDICPVSQSAVAYRVLERRGVPTGMVVYPGEGHGFDRPGNQRDRDTRTLEWFQRHMPTK